MSAVRHTLILVTAFLLCLGAQQWALRASGGRALKSESNFFSSLARIQAGIREPRAGIYLLGSSITGRLPDRSQGFEGVANLGCDGASAVDTLRAIDEGLLPPAPMMVIEGNTLHRAVSAPPTEIARAMHSPWFRIGESIPALGAGARPAAFAYSWLMTRKMGQVDGRDGPALPVGSLPEVALGQVALSEAESALVAELAQRIRRIESKGSRVLVAMMPPGVPPQSPNYRVPKALASLAGLAWWDLAENLPPSAIRLTDGVHMDPNTAAATLRSLTAGLASLSEKAPR